MMLRRVTMATKHQLQQQEKKKKMQMDKDEEEIVPALSYQLVIRLETTGCHLRPTHHLQTTTKSSSISHQRD